MQADPGLQRRAERLIGGLNEGRRALCSWNQDSIGPASDEVSMDDLTPRFQTIKNIQPRLASDHARLQTHVLQLVNKQSQKAVPPPREQRLQGPLSGSSSSGTFCQAFYTPGTAELLARGATKRSNEETSQLFFLGKYSV